MALVLYDRVQQTGTANTTVSFTLSGSVTGYQSFSVIGNGNTTYYGATDSIGNWEVGIGTYSTTGPTLTRTTILSSSNAGAAETFTGSVNVFVTYPAGKSVNGDGTTIQAPAGALLPIANGGTSGQVIESTGITGWSYSGLSKSVAAEETTPQGLFFKPDGLSMYLNGSTGDDVNQYTLSSAWDVSTATYLQTFSTAAQDTAPVDLFFKPDGLSMFIMGSTNDTVYQYTLSSAWDISTASYASKSFSVTSQESVPNGLWFKSDGTIMYVIGTSADTVFQYNLGTAWDVSTASYASISFSVASQDSAPTQVNLSANGLTMWVLGSTGDDISEYTLGTAWNVSTATYVGKIYVGFQDTAPTGLFIDSTADNRVYMTGSTSDTVFQYNTATNAISVVADVFNTTGNTTIGGNLSTSSAYVDGTLTVQGNTATLGTNTFSGTTTLSTTTISGTLTASSTITLSGSTSGVTGLGTAATTGTTTIGGTSQTGTITVGQSTATQTTNIQAGATAAGSTKTINIGTAGLSGSTTNITIGSAVSGATSTTTLNGNVGIGTSAPAYKLDVLGTNDYDVNARVNGALQTYNSGSSTRAYGFLSVDVGNTAIGGNLRLDTNVTTGSHIGYSKGTDQRGGSAIIFDNNSSANNYGDTIFIQSNDTNDDTWVVRETMRINNAGRLGIGTSAPSAVLQLKAGTATASTAPLKFTSGTNLTTPEAGAVEYDGTVFYGDFADSARGVFPTESIVVLNTAYTLTSQTAAQQIFNNTASGALTLPAGTYQFECGFSLSSMSASSGSYGFAFGGGATFTQQWRAIATKTAAQATVANGLMSFNTAANTTLVTANTSTFAQALIRGIINITVGGTIIPQVSLGVAAAAVVGVGSYFRISPISGTSGTTNITVGNWS